MRGLSMSGLLDLYEQKPPRHELVIYSQKTMWVVEDISLVKCTLKKMEGTTVTEKKFESMDPQPTNYWYMPLESGSLKYSEIEENEE